ncbi:3-hydroxy-3-methylglutaryl coenzyme A synthase [Polyrhizophydium stewartii]|uniref:Hydroxymethylglutaryl-CoA synthase n=1 Tax=Polyrhizophydium stewartii TaxID=2732419 RepID=A0ABR4NF69_9FUNG
MAAPINAGIHAVEFYVAKKCVDQTELEKFDGASAGKYTIGLGQQRMAFCDDREDINSICLTAVKSLMDKYNVSYDQIGRLEVGTETIIDKSKSVKSVLMQLFAESGNTNVEGVDTTNACYGGTNALFNSLNWLESSSWDGRYALVVAADIAVYKNGSARPTGGVGAAAILLGRDAPIVFDQGMRVSHIEHVWDFYKPDLHSEYPEVDGPLSNMCYTKAVDICYNRYLDKLEQRGVTGADSSYLDFMLFHCPYTKLVQKSYARLAFNDARRHPESGKFDEAALALAATPIDKTYTSKDIEKVFMGLTKDAFAQRVAPGLIVAKNVGNSYCASLYGGLASLLSYVSSEQLQNKRVGMFSYGSGLASSFFSFVVRGSTETIAKNLNIAARLAARTVVEPSKYDETLTLRQAVHNARDYQPVGPVDADNFFPGTFYLERVDEKFRRTYGRFEL